MRDLVFRNALICDGYGGAITEDSVGVNGTEIAAIDKDRLLGRTVVDAKRMNAASG